MELIKKLGFSKTMYIVLTVLATSLITTFTNLTRLSKYELIQRMGRCLFYFVAISFFLGTLRIVFHPETFNLNKLLLKGGKIAFVLVFADIIFVKKEKAVL